mmetsp:Transcript_1995/g.12707  ORF Transcript_1995/g.12707 Transcript_1995/m.12707 type:complete len:158 (+) Transcript_1995:2322-2795(+)
MRGCPNATEAVENSKQMPSADQRQLPTPKQSLNTSEEAPLRVRAAFRLSFEISGTGASIGVTGIVQATISLFHQMRGKGTIYSTVGEGRVQDKLRCILRSRDNCPSSFFRSHQRWTCTSFRSSGHFLVPFGRWCAFFLAAVPYGSVVHEPFLVVSRG